MSKPASRFLLTLFVDRVGLVGSEGWAASKRRGAVDDGLGHTPAKRV